MVFFLDISAVVTSSGSPMAGQSFSLTCSVTGADSLAPTIFYQLVQRTSQSVTSSSVLSFDSLCLSDVGLYRCEVIIRSDRLSEEEQLVFASYDIQFPS